MTDNPTRTVADVRHAFTKNGGNLGTSGAVAYMFTRVGQIFFETGDDAALEERILEAALEAGADDVVSEDGWTEVLSSPASFETVKQALDAAGFKPAQADVTLRPGNVVAVAGQHAESEIGRAHVGTPVTN